MSAELKKQAAARHPGLCGHPHAWAIAAVKTQDVETKWGSTTGNKYRNQGRLDFTYIACVVREREKLQLFSMKVGKGTSSCIMYCVDCCRAS